jgi:hypothetical protein
MFNILKRVKFKCFRELCPSGKRVAEGLTNTSLLYPTYIAPQLTHAFRLKNYFSSIVFANFPSVTAECMKMRFTQNTHNTNAGRPLTGLHLYQYAFDLSCSEHSGTAAGGRRYRQLNNANAI